MAVNEEGHGYIATVAVRFPGSVCTPDVVEKSGQLRQTQDVPVPTGLTGAFQRLLQIYREYRSATAQPSAQPGQQDKEALAQVDAG